MGRNLKDADFTETDVALPNGNTTSYSTDIDLGAALAGNEIRPEGVELYISVPALTVTHLPNGETLTVNVVAGAAASPTGVIMGSVLVFTGAGGAGAAANTARLRLPSNCPRYLRVAFAGSATAGNMSAVDAEVSLLF